MADQNEGNRSDALTPSQLALVNSMVSASVKEAVSGVFAQLLPILKDVKEMALTPEKLKLMEEIRRAPTDEQKKAQERADREREDSREQAAQEVLRQKAIQDNCLHRDSKGMEALCPIHNYPDHQTRAICPHCHALIEPRHWEYGSPKYSEVIDPRTQQAVIDPKTGKTKMRWQAKAELVPEHKDYARVRALDSMN